MSCFENPFVINLPCYEMQIYNRLIMYNVSGLLCQCVSIFGCRLEGILRSAGMF